ncbi:hypothetical protein ACH5RR_016451 [Cinchona calisaya]|uniref:non-specific serine/threonine protein kinase n=1 Tax=Cinchona calisaya TaxID=153742 RepID=A0ABD2ZW33_9GENT
MHLYLVSVAILFCCIFFCHQPVTLGFSIGTTPAPYYLGDVAINCGSIGNLNALDGRKWIGDSSGSAALPLQPQGKSRSSVTIAKSLSADPVPYATSRISANQFYYRFQVNPGQKFIRLHFYPTSYHGFEKSRDFFTVKAGPFTLLSNFSASLAAEYLGVKYLIKEFCINVEHGRLLYITFFPSRISNSKKNIHAFINGIEIVSMPDGLYYTPHGGVGARVVGRDYLVHIDDNTALEMVQRLNTGGSSISSVEDFGMFRRWIEDSDFYFSEPLVHPVYNQAHIIKYASTPPYIAPLPLYQTSWKLEREIPAGEMYHFTWKIPVDVGFAYFIRLHFCEFGSEMTESGLVEFNILVNNQIAETKADVIRWSGGNGIAVYRDYTVMMKGDKEEGKCDLLIVLQSDDELVIGFLKGLEIFKLSNPDNSLASPNPVLAKKLSTSWTMKIKKMRLAFGQRNTIATIVTILITSLNVIVYILRQSWVKNFQEEKYTRSASNEPSCQCIPLADILSATQNFSDEFIIGKGGFGKVYKGFIHSIAEIVAIKRSNSKSMQGVHEFWTEIGTLSRLQHNHLVPLIGYCNESREMILVYQYMPHGTLADNLYKKDRNGTERFPLSWEQRLRICIGAARGLDYLHTGTGCGIIHRDVKDTNILLDENFNARISDFGLSKLEMISQSRSYVSTKVKGTFGYLDPDYVLTHKLTRKSDVYAFGVVMLVVLCGRPAVDTRIPGEPQSLLWCFQECLTKGEIDELVDPSLLGKSSPDSLKAVVETIEKCLQHQPKRRPTMAQVVVSLEYALEQQESTLFSTSEKTTGVSQSYDETETTQSFQHDPFREASMLQDGVLSPPEEGLTRKPIQKAILPTEGNNLQLKNKDDSPVQNRHWMWDRWETLWNRAWRKKDLLSPHRPCHCFSIADIRAATDNLSNTRVILNDEYKNVYIGLLEHLQMAVCMSRFKTKVYDEEVLGFCSEIEMLSKLRHPNLLSLIGYCCHKNEMFIVYDYVGSYTLHSYLYDTKTKCLSWKQRLRICIAAAKGLEYLHKGVEQRIIHRDVRPANILLDQNLSPRISNFGLSKVGPTGQLAKASTVIESSCLEYLSPDFIIYGPQLTEKSDVYSFGLMLLEILCCQRPKDFHLKVKGDKRRHPADNLVKRSIRTKTLHQIIDVNLKGEIATSCLAEFLKIAFACLLFQANERPTMGNVEERLEFALQLQENAAGKRDGVFSLKDVYQEISDIAADELFNSTSSFTI